MKIKSLSAVICLMLVISIFIGVLNFSPTVMGEQGAPHDDGVFPDITDGDNIWTTNADWVIEPTDNIVHENKTIHVMGNLYVNGSLTLTNVTLQMGNATYDGEYNITVLESGNLVIQDYDDDPNTVTDASIIESISGFRFGFQAYPSSQLEIKNSELYDCGWSTSPYVDGLGLFIYTDWVKVTGNYINDSHFGVLLWDCNNVTFANNTINGAQDIGVYTDGAEHCYLWNNTLTNILNFGFYIYNSIFINVSYNSIINNPTAYGISILNGGGHDVYNNTLNNNEIGVFVHADGTSYITSYCYIFDNDISNNARGIQVQGLDGVSAVQYIYIYDNEIYLNGEYGIILYGDNGPYAVNNIYLFDNKVYNNGGGGGHGIRFIGNTYFGDVGLVYCLNNEVRDNNIAADTASGYFLDSVREIYILNDNISRNDRNLWVDSSDNVYVTNSSLGKSTDPGDVDIRIEDNWGNPPSVYLLNTTFDKGSATVLDAGSFLNVRWYLHIRVKQYGSGADNANVWIDNTYGNPEPSTGQPLSTGTGNDGWIRWLRVTEFNRTFTAGTTYYTPHHIYVEKGSANGSADPNMDLSKEVIINLNSPPTADNISSTDFSVPRGQEINITANATDPEDSEDILTPYFEYIDPNVPGWNTTYLGTPIYIGTAPSGFWQVNFTPPGNAPLGLYEFRVKFEDPNGSSSSWLTNLFVIVQGNPPVADAGPDDTISAGTPYPFDGSGSTDDEGIENYTWNFIYNSTDIYLYDVSPMFTFNIPGVYIVTLIVEDAQSEWDIDTVQITVVDDEPPTVDAGSDASVKINTPYDFDASGSWDNVGIVWYNWTFDDGYYDNGTNITPTHTYTSLGTYTVTLKCSDASGNWAIGTLNITVIASDPPVAEAGPDNSTNEDSSIVFNGSLSTDDFGIVSYYWDVDASNGLNWITPDLVGMEVIWIYNTPGFYKVTLRVIDGDGGFDMDFLNVTVHDLTPPIANAGSSVTIDEDTPYQLDGSLSTDNSGSIAFYNWNFGDGNYSNGTNPKPFHTYAHPGFYTVTLNVTDSAGNWDTDTVWITVLDITPPTANAGPGNTTNEDSPISFDGSASYDNYDIAGMLSYKWDMDDSDGLDWVTPDQTGLKPIHVYFEPGNYIVTLNVTDTAGNSGFDTLTVWVFDITPPIANAGPDGFVNEDSPYNFDGSGSSDNVAIFTYAWDVDASDGVDWSSPDYTSVNPSHIYSNPGIYIATLNVTDEAGHWSTDTVVITARDITPPSAEAGPDDSVYNGTAYVFDGSLSTDNSGLIIFYNWSFGDGSFANGTDPNPVHTYTIPGLYTVVLTVTDAAGNTDTDIMTIKVIDTRSPNADAGVDATVSEGSPHTFDGSNSYDDIGIAKYAWDIDATNGINWNNPDYSGPNLWNPVHTYTVPGFYTVTLNVTDGDGNWDIDTVFITVKDTTPPIADAGPPATINEDTPYMLDGSGSYDPEGGTITWYNWTFGDGNFLYGSDPQPFHTYTQPGPYTVTLNVTDTDRNWALDTASILVLDVTPPTADAGTDDSVNEGSSYTFDASGSFDNVGITCYAWDMDDSDGIDWSNPDKEGSNLWNPGYTYTEPGIYTVTLRINDTSGNWNIDEVIITVLDVTPPTANAGPNDTVNEDISYALNSSGSSDNVGISTFEWDIDASDGLDWINPDYTGSSPLHLFSQPGVYTVTLRATDAAGNFALDTVVITVLDTTPPVANAGPDDEFDEDKPYSFNASASTDNVGIVNYSWDMDKNDGIDWGNPDYTGMYPTHIFTEPGTYIVTLRTSDAQGNWATDTMVIKVTDVTKPILKAEFEKTIDEKVEHEYNASLSSDNTGIATYLFVFGDGSSLSGNEAVVPYSYPNSGTYVVTVTITDDAGNWNSSSWFIFVRDTTPPLKPSGLSISKISTGGALNISWLPNSEEDLNHYILYFSDDGVNFDDSFEFSSEKSSYVHSGLINGWNYSYYLVAVDNSGLSSQPSNIVKAFPEKDSDGDGTFDSEDEDDDNDGVKDDVDAFPYNPDEWSDTNGDGIGDNTDDDDDGDGVIDVKDDLPFNPTETLDTDGDGIGNNADKDDDGDGKPDVSDDYPLDPEKWKAPFDFVSILLILLVIIAAVVAIILFVLLSKQKRMNSQLLQRVDQLELEATKPKELPPAPSALKPRAPPKHRPPRIIEKPPKPPLTPPPPPPPTESLEETPSDDLFFEEVGEGEEPSEMSSQPEPEDEGKSEKEEKKSEQPPPSE